MFLPERGHRKHCARQTGWEGGLHGGEWGGHTGKMAIHSQSGNTRKRDGGTAQCVVCACMCVRACVFEQSVCVLVFRCAE